VATFPLESRKALAFMASKTGLLAA